MLDGARDAIKGLWERLTDPFIFATGLCWAVMNWRFFVVLLHEGTIGESHTELLETATAQLGFNWTQCHEFNLALPVIGAVTVGLAYSFGYPILSARIRVWRDYIKAKVAKDVALMNGRFANEIKRTNHLGQLLTRDEWLAGEEMSHMRDVENELLESLKNAYSSLAPRYEPRVGLPFYYPIPFGPLNGFAQHTPDGKVVPLSPPPYTNENLVYVFSVLSRSNRCFAAPFGVPFPLPDADTPGRRLEFLTRQGIEFGETAPLDCIAHVKVLDESRRWGMLVNGAPGNG